MSHVLWATDPMATHCTGKTPQARHHILGSPPSTGNWPSPALLADTVIRDISIGSFLPPLPLCHLASRSRAGRRSWKTEVGARASGHHTSQTNVGSGDQAGTCGLHVNPSLTTLVYAVLSHSMSLGRLTITLSGQNLTELMLVWSTSMSAWEENLPLWAR